MMAKLSVMCERNSRASTVSNSVIGVAMKTGRTRAGRGKRTTATPLKLMAVVIALPSNAVKEGRVGLALCEKAGESVEAAFADTVLYQSELL